MGIMSNHPKMIGRPADEHFVKQLYPVGLQEIKRGQGRKDAGHRQEIATLVFEISLEERGRGEAAGLRFGENLINLPSDQKGRGRPGVQGDVLAESEGEPGDDRGGKEGFFPQRSGGEFLQEDQVEKGDKGKERLPGKAGHDADHGDRQEGPSFGEEFCSEQVHEDVDQGAKDDEEQPLHGHGRRKHREQKSQKKVSPGRVGEADEIDEGKLSVESAHGFHNQGGFIPVQDDALIQGQVENQASGEEDQRNDPFSFASSHVGTLRTAFQTARRAGDPWSFSFRGIRARRSNRVGVSLPKTRRSRSPLIKK